MIETLTSVIDIQTAKSVKAAQALTKAEAALRKELVAVDKLLSRQRKTYEGLEDKVRKGGRAQEDATVKLKRAVAQQQLAIKIAKQYGISVTAARKAVLRFGKDVARAGKEAAGYAVQIDKAERETRELTKAQRAAAGGSSRMLASTKALALGLLSVGAAIRVIQAGGRAFVGFESEMASVKAVTAATASEMANMTAVARQLGETTPKSATEAAAGMAFLGRAGFDAQEVMAAIPATLDLSTAAMIGLGEASDITSNIMSAFSVPADEARRIADAMASTASNSNTNIMQLGEAMKFVGPVASALGISMEDSAAAIGILGNAGLQGTIAGTGLKRILSELLDPSDKAKAALRGMGIAIEEVNPETHSLTEIMGTLSDANIGAAQAFDLIGDRGAPALLALVSQVDDLRELTKEVNNSGGAVAAMAAIMQDTTAGSLELMRSAAKGLAIAIGTELAPAMRATIDALTGILRAMPKVGKATQALLAPISMVIEGYSLLIELSRELGGTSGLEEVSDDLDTLIGQFEELGGVQGALEVTRGIVFDLIASVITFAAESVGSIFDAVAAVQNGVASIGDALADFTGLDFISEMSRQARIGGDALQILADDARDAGREAADGFREMSSASFDAAINISNAAGDEVNSLIAVRDAASEAADAVAGIGGGSQPSLPVFGSTSEGVVDLTGRTPDDSSEAMSLANEWEALKARWAEEDSARGEAIKTGVAERKEAEQEVIDAILDGADKWTSAFDDIAQALSSIDGDLAAMFSGAGDISNALGNLNAAKAQGGGGFFSPEQRQAGAATAGFISAGAGALGLTGGGISGFGGENAGNLMAEGAQVGGQVGGVWGAVVGAFVGAMVSTGADDMFAHLEEAQGRADLVVTMAEGGLAEIAGQIEFAIETFANNLQDALLSDLNFDDILDIHIREDLIEVTADGVTRVFRTIEEALAFAAQGILAANADADGLGKNMKALFEKLTGPVLRGGMEDIQDALNLAALLDARQGDATGLLTKRRQELMDIGRRYGLSLKDIIDLENDRIAAQKAQLQAAAGAVFGVTDVAGSISELTAQFVQFDAELAFENQARQDRVGTIEEELAAYEGLEAALEEAGAGANRLEDALDDVGLDDPLERGGGDTSGGGAGIGGAGGITGTTEEGDDIAGQALSKSTAIFVTGVEDMGEQVGDAGAEAMQSAGVKMSKEGRVMAGGITTAVVDGLEQTGGDIADAAGDAVGGDLSGKDLDFDTRNAILETEEAMQALAEEAEALTGSLDGIPEGFGADTVGALWTSAVGQVGESLIQMIQAVRGPTANIKEQEAFRHQLFMLQLAAQIQQAQLVLSTMTGVSDGVRLMFEGVIADGLSLLDDLSTGAARLPSQRGGGGGRRKQKLEEARRAEEEAAKALADFTAQLTTMSRNVGSASGGLGDLADQLDAVAQSAVDAAAAGMSAADAAEFQRLQFQQLRREFLESFRTEGRQTNFLSDAAGIESERQAAMEEARLIAAEQAAQLGIPFDVALRGMEETITEWARRMNRGLVAEMIDGLNLPLEKIRSATKANIKAFKDLTLAFNSGAIAIEKYERLVEQVQQAQELAFGSDLLSLLDKYFGVVEGGEELRRDLEMIRFEMEIANIKLQFELLKQAGMLSEAAIAQFGSLIGFIDDNPIDWDAFFAGSGGGGGGGRGAGSGSSGTPLVTGDAFADLSNLADALRDFVRGFDNVDVGRFESQARDWIATIGDFNNDIADAMNTIPEGQVLTGAEALDVYAQQLFGVSGIADLTTEQIEDMQAQLESVGTASGDWAAGLVDLFLQLDDLARVELDAPGKLLDMFRGTFDVSPLEALNAEYLDIITALGLLEGSAEQFAEAEEIFTQRRLELMEQQTQGLRDIIADAEAIVLASRSPQEQLLAAEAEFAAASAAFDPNDEASVARLEEAARNYMETAARLDEFIGGDLSVAISQQVRDALISVLSGDLPPILPPEITGVGGGVLDPGDDIPEIDPFDVLNTFGGASTLTGDPSMLPGGMSSSAPVFDLRPIQQEMRLNREASALETEKLRMEIASLRLDNDRRERNHGPRLDKQTEALVTIARADLR